MNSKKGYINKHKHAETKGNGNHVNISSYMNLKLWQSLYSYNGEFPGSLSFKEKELFLVLRKENEYWFLVSDKDGTLGCVPINYLKMIEISEKKLLKYIEKAIVSLSQKSASIISRRDDIIRDLLEYKNQNKILEISQNDIDKVNNISVKPVPPSLIPDGLAFMLTDIIRQSTKASHKCSVKTLQILLDTLDCNIPDLKMWTGAIITQLLSTSQFNLETAFYNSGDWLDLTELFEFFQQRKNDSQERSWSLHENVTELKNKLFNLLKILKTCNHSLVICFLESFQYDPLLSLIELYQMEQRIILRQLLLQIFIVCCEINQKSIDICLQSILPLELVRDLLDTNINYKNFSFATILLTIIVSGCELMNIDLREKLNSDFCGKMLYKLSEFHNTVLSASVTGRDDKYDLSCSFEEENHNVFHFKDPIYMDDIIVGFLLTLNKRFKDVKSNPVIISLQSKPEYTRLFIEKLVQAFNRDNDPAAMTSYIEDCDLIDDVVKKSDSSSVRKILCDIHSSKKLADIIYRNDEDVIIDIIARELCNLSSTSASLSEYLMLLDLIILNSDYLERGKYKAYDLKSALNVLKNDDIGELENELVNSILEKLDHTVV